MSHNHISINTGVGFREGNSADTRNQRSNSRTLDRSSPINNHMQRPLTMLGGTGLLSDRVLTQRNTNTAATSVHNMAENNNYENDFEGGETNYQ